MIEEKENLCGLITGFASDAQKLVDRINYTTESSICAGVLSNSLVHAGFYLCATAACE